MTELTKTGKCQGNVTEFLVRKEEKTGNCIFKSIGSG